MTQQFQVGDIVYVNPLSEDDRLFRTHQGSTDDIDSIVGHHAVIESVECIEDTIVRLSACDPDYVFKMEDIPTVFRSTSATTRANHLTFVRPSTLRASRISDRRFTSTALKTIPFAGSMLSGTFSFLNGKYLDTILDGAVIDEVYLHRDGVGLRCCNLDAEEYDVNEYVTLVIPTQHISSSQANALFTTF